MARITVEDCMKRVDNRFDLVLMATKRARMLAQGGDPMVSEDDDKPTVIALREIADGLVDQTVIDELEKQAREAAEAEAWNREEALSPPSALF